MSYTGEEPSCDLYWTNDKKIAGTYVVETYFEDEKMLDAVGGETSHYELSEEEAKDLFKKILSAKNVEYKDSASIDELKTQIYDLELDDDSYITINQYEYVETEND